MLANWIHPFKLKDPDSAIKEFVDIIVKQVREVNSARDPMVHLV